MLSGSTQLRDKCLPPVVLAAMVVVFFAPVLIRGRIPLLGDLCFLFYPRYMFFQETIRRGAMPLWNPYTGCGEPFLADIEQGVFYPPNLIYLILPVSRAIVMMAVFHVLLAGVGAYGLCRAWRLSRAASCLAGVTYAFNSYTIIHVEFPSELGSAAWFPCVLMAYIFWLRRRDRRSLMLLSLGICLQFLAGFPETMAFTVGALVLCALFAAFYRWRLRGGWWTPIVPMLGLGAAGGLALLLAMAQFLPTWEAFQASARGGVVDPGLDISSIHPLAIFSLLVPSVYGVHAPFSIPWGNYWAPSCLAYWIGAFYVGVVPVTILIAVGFRRALGSSATQVDAGHPDEACALRVPFLITLLTVSFLYCMGKYTPVFALCQYAMPFLRHFVTPPKCLLCVVFPLSCLAAIGMDWLARVAEQDRQHPRTVPELLAKWGAVLMFAGVAVLVALLLSNHGTLGKFLLTRLFNLGSVEPRFAHRIPWGILVRDSLKLPIVGITCALLLQAYNVQRLRRLGPCAIILLSFADLWVTNSVVLSPGPASILSGPSDWLQRLKPEGKMVRYFAIERFWFDSERGLVDGLADAHPTDVIDGAGPRLASDREQYEALGRILRRLLHLSWPMVDKAYNVYAHSRLASNDVQMLYTIVLNPTIPRNPRERLLRMFNCDRVVLFPDPKDLFAHGRLDAPRIATFSEPLPRAYVVGGVRIIDTPEGVLQGLVLTDFDPLSLAFIEGGSPGRDQLANLPPEHVPHRVDRFEYGPNQLEIEVTSQRSGLLVVSDTYAAGWVATVDGKEVPIYKVNYAFRGVRVPAGTSVVKMEYRPMSVRLGIGISLMALILVVVLALPRRAARPRQ